MEIIITVLLGVFIILTGVISYYQFAKEMGEGAGKP